MRAPLAKLAFFLLVASCGASDEAPAIRIAWRHHLTLLDEAERADRSVTVGAFSPRGSVHGPGGGLPALVMKPPASVTFDLSGLPSQARLRFTAGVSNEGYDRELPVSIGFAVELDGELVFDETVCAAASVPLEKRNWLPGELSLDGAKSLQLRTTLTEGASFDARLGFGLLEVEVPVVSPLARADTARPSVLLILIDTLRADRLHTYGGPREVSPVIDALAERGVLYERAFAPTPWTLPSTTAVLTGLEPPEQAQALFERGACWLDEGLTTLAEAFQEAGYVTGAFSTNVMISEHRNFDQGFDHFVLRPRARASELNRDIRAWLRARDDECFFLYVHLFDPHGPYEPEPDLREHFAPEAPEGYTREATRAMVEMLGRGEPFDSEQLQRYIEHHLALYDAEIAGADRAIGSWLQALRELDRLDDTLVMVTSDHGEEFLEHGMTGHAKQLYPESMHVPLILAGPGVPRNRRIQRPVENRHLAPTLLALAGLRARDNLDLPTLPDEEHADDAPAAPIFLTTQIGEWLERDTGLLGTAPIHGVQREDELFLWYGRGLDEGAQRRALFELAGDPRALVDLAPARGERLEAGRREVEEWLSRGARRRPSEVDSWEAVQELLKGLGYTGGDE